MVAVNDLHNIFDMLILSLLLYKWLNHACSELFRSPQ